jgi:hypothetical protein
MMAFLMPIRRPMTSTTGVMQFVVQLAQEMIRAPSAWFTPWTNVRHFSLLILASRRMPW